MRFVGFFLKCGQKAPVRSNQTISKTGCRISDNVDTYFYWTDVCPRKLLDGIRWLDSHTINFDRRGGSEIDWRQKERKAVLGIAQANQPRRQSNHIDTGNDDGDVDSDKASHLSGTQRAAVATASRTGPAAPGCASFTTSHDDEIRQAIRSFFRRASIPI